MKRLLFNLIVLITVVVLLDSCSSAKRVAYFQNIDSVDLSASQGLYDAKIMPKDMLTIIVNTTNPDAARPFNLYSATVSGQSGNNNMQGYLVDNSGNINFPVIGKVHVSGLTKGQCEDLIDQVDAISDYSELGKLAKENMKQNFTWEKIVGEYEELFLS